MVGVHPGIVAQHQHLAMAYGRVREDALASASSYGTQEGGLELLSDISLLFLLSAFIAIHLLLQFSPCELRWTS